ASINHEMEYDVRNLIHRSTTSKLILQLLFTFLGLGILVAVFSVIGGIANLYFFPYMIQFSSVGNMIRLSNQLSYDTTELINSNTSYFSKQTLMETLNKHNELLLRENEALKHGDPTLGTKGILSDPKFYRLYHNGSCEFTGENYECLDLQTLLNF